MELLDKDKIVSFLKDNNIWAKKSMGQNFLVDGDVAKKIIATSEVGSEDTILEIGPGLGALTEELAKQAGKVFAIEKDAKLASILNNKLNAQIKIINGDALEFDPKQLAPKSYKLIANIPYYITSKILEKYLTAKHKPELIVLLVQKEVAERICALPGDLSVLAISVQYFGEPEIVETVSKKCFYPVPKVDSAILKIKTFHKKFDQAYDKKFFRCVKHGFASKRKTMLNNLAAGYRLDKKIIIDIIEKIGLNKNCRAQELTLQQWQELAREFD